MTLPRSISFKTLIVASLIADFCDLFTIFILGAPGPHSLVIDVPITILHFMFAGPIALVTFTEYIPLLGLLPLYTVAAFVYLGLEKKSAPPPQPVPQTASEPEYPKNVTPPPPARALFPPNTVITDVDADARRPRENAQTKNVADRLAKLAQLLREQHISQAEHDAKRQQILEEL